MKHSLFLILLITTAALNYLHATFGSQGQVAYAVMVAESSGDAYAVSPTGDYGLMQINLSAHWGDISGATADEKIQWLFNPYNNINEAKYLYDDSQTRTGCGWCIWNAYLNGRYAQFL